MKFYKSQTKLSKFHWMGICFKLSENVGCFILLLTEIFIKNKNV